MDRWLRTENGREVGDIGDDELSVDAISRHALFFRDKYIHALSGAASVRYDKCRAEGEIKRV